MKPFTLAVFVLFIGLPIFAQDCIALPSGGNITVVCVGSGEVQNCILTGSSCENVSLLYWEDAGEGYYYGSSTLYCNWYWTEWAGPGGYSEAEIGNCVPWWGFAASKPKTVSHRAYAWSVVSLVAGNAADASTSWGLREANPILGTRFNLGSLAIKGGLSGVALLWQWIDLRRHPSDVKQFTWQNFASGVALGGVAVHNFRLR